MRHRCVVVGAGIIGSALAARLAVAGADVTIVDAAEPGSGTSGSSLAWVNANGKPPRAYHDLNAAGIRAWREWAAALGAHWFRPGGSLHWAEPAAAGRLAAHVDALTRWDYPARLLTPRQALDLEPGIAPPFGVREVAHFPDEAYLLVAPAIETLLRLAAEHGATLVERDRVTDLLVRGGAVRGVALGSGGRIEADTVALCAGWRTPALASRLDVDVPLVPIDAPGSPAPCLVAWTTPSRAALGRLLVTPSLDLRPAGAGRFFLEAGDLDDRVDLGTGSDQLAAIAERLLRRARAVLPGLADATLAEHRVCVRPLPADGRSIVGRPAAPDGCYVIVTHSGVTLAAHLAALATGEILTETDHPDLAPFRLQRL
ncbi:MAG TPA: FAD-dependent oxidoreductase [Candidatus Dormibacteraeota bacterium]|nr:FAD-dependent oxidoreductase [Candidatus Dormibacteraeota bacterium]